jgi:hypothetical protein
MVNSTATKGALSVGAGSQKASVAATKGTFSVRAWIGDSKTLLAFNLSDKKSAKNLAGFTIQCKPEGQAPYYILNDLRFKIPGNHAQDASQPEFSSINAPIHKFRWLHVPGSFHQGTEPLMGPYTYTVTPRYFDSKQSMLALDPNRSVSVAVNVGPFKKGSLQLGFARGFVQSQAFAHHFGKDALIRPKGKDLLFDTSQIAGTNAAGQKATFDDEYKWSGFTARQRIFEILDEVAANGSLSLKVFAYDLNEPKFCQALLDLAAKGKVQIILDNASLHHDAKSSTPEDQFEQLFKKKAAHGSAILRGKFGRFAHDKVLIVSNGQDAKKVLTGSTNFSVTGIYVNSNHVLVFDDPQVAAHYSKVFDEVWNDQVNEKFQNSPLAATPFTVTSADLPKATITFSPHTQPTADGILKGIINRIGQVKGGKNPPGSVLFAVMQLDDTAKNDSGKSAGKTGNANPVYAALRNLHKKEDIFSYGISDSPGGIFLHSQGKPNGVLVTGKPGATQLPPPFDQVANVMGHQIHHKFVVCDFNGSDPVVFCGSSNLAPGGEHLNGDNLLEIHDAEVAAAFAIEAVSLVDHFSFLDRSSKGNKQSGPAANKRQAAVSAGWFLSTDDKWTDSYFDSKDLYFMDRQLFA